MHKVTVPLTELIETGCLGQEHSWVLACMHVAKLICTYSCSEANEFPQK